MVSSYRKVFMVEIDSDVFAKKEKSRVHYFSQCEIQREAYEMEASK